MKQFPHLFSPIQVGTMTVKNRIFMPAMGTQLCTQQNMITDEAIAYYERRAKGGVGLITTEVVMFDEHSHYGGPVNMGLYSDTQIPGMKALADAVHKYGAKLVPQLMHAGAAAGSALNGGRQPRSASPIPLRQTEIPMEMPLEEIHEFVQRIGEAALRAKKAGCDGVEIHACHRHGVLGSFLSPLGNRRTDEYGGNIDGRLKLPLEAIAQVRKMTGEDFPIIVRMSMTESEPGGQSLLDAIYIAKAFENAGVNMLNLSNGTLDTYWKTVTPIGTPRGVNTELAEKVKATVNIPVGVNGRNCEPWSSELVLALERVDAVYMGRALLCDPDLPIKAMEGRLEEIRPCIGCTDCITHRYTRERACYCSMNPDTGRETLKVPPVAPGKRLLVIGGGPAGLQAAISAARRGFDVTLAEKKDRLGGEMYAASFPPGKQELAVGLKFLIQEAQRKGVKLLTNTCAGVDFVKQFAPDNVIVATGGKPIMPKFLSGAKHLVTAQDALTGAQPTGQNIVIIGGGSVGCETADYLIHPQNDRDPGGKQVTIVEMRNNIAIDDTTYSRSLMVRRLLEKGCTILTEAKVESVQGNTVVYNCREQLFTLENIDTVVVALGTVPETGLCDDLAAAGIPFVAVGNAGHVGRIYDALYTGALAAENLV